MTIKEVEREKKKNFFDDSEKLMKVILIFH
jgi:hypothetical protein